MSICRCPLARASPGQGKHQRIEVLDFFSNTKLRCLLVIQMYCSLRRQACGKNKNYFEIGTMLILDDALSSCLKSAALPTPASAIRENNGKTSATHRAYCCNQYNENCFSPN
jgi:hypothetical protein